VWREEEKVKTREKRMGRNRTKRRRRKDR
jgi:hypothetical protein